MENSEALEVIELLSEHELKLGELYRSFAMKFDPEFWNHIADEEGYHSEWILVLKKYIEEGRFAFSDKRFNTFLIEDAINHLNSLIMGNQEISLSIRRAFEIAYELEKSMAEGDLFKILNSDAPELAKVLDKLQEATIKHIEEIRVEMENRAKTDYSSVQS